MKFPFKKVASQPPIDSSNVMKLFLSETVRPFLKQAGFSKYGSAFYRNRGDMIDVIHFQASKWNRSGESEFFVNCCMDSTRFQIDVHGVANKRLPYTSCVYTKRMHELIDSQTSFVLAKEGRVVDIADFSAVFLQKLQQVLHRFDTIESTDDLVDLAIASNGLSNYEELCLYLSKYDDIERLTSYIGILHKRFSGHDARWPFFAQKIYKQIGKYVENEQIASMLSAREV